MEEKKLPHGHFEGLRLRRARTKAKMHMGHFHAAVTSIGGSEKKKANYKLPRHVLKDPTAEDDDQSTVEREKNVGEKAIKGRQVFPNFKQGP